MFFQQKHLAPQSIDQRRFWANITGCAKVLKKKYVKLVMLEELKDECGQGLTGWDVAEKGSRSGWSQMSES